MSLVMASTHKPKVQEAAPERRRDNADGATSGGADTKPAEVEATAAEAEVKLVEAEAKPAQAEAKPIKAVAQTDAEVAPDEPKPTRSRTKVAVSGAGKPAGA